MSDSLRKLARECGVLTSYVGNDGSPKQASPEALLAILQALGLSLEHADDAKETLQSIREHRGCELTPPCHVIFDGAPMVLPMKRPVLGPVAMRIEREDGEVLEHAPECEGTSLPLPELPWGVHRVILQGASPMTTHIIRGPSTTYGSESMTGSWGAFAPLYALRHLPHGMGTLAELRHSSEWLAKYGADFIATLPMLAQFLDPPCFEYSPYSPASRLFWNECFADIAVLPGWNECSNARKQWKNAEPTLLNLDQDSHVDYAAQFAARRPTLQALADFHFDRSQSAIHAYLEKRPAVADYAAFRAKVAAEQASWQDWKKPRELPGRDNADFRYHAFGQYAMDTQLSDLAAAMRQRGSELYLDLPVGVSGDGFEVWQTPDLFALDASAGAPPDALFAGGQNWGFPPLHPEQSRRQGHRYFRSILQHHMEHAGILRIDHVMGLARMYWVPQGMSAKEGVYVTYPDDELWALVCLESHRNQTRLMGEDLGTVPDGVVRAMEKHKVLRTYVGQFSLGHKGDMYPPNATQVAALNTHDTPTFAGFRRGTDIDDRVDLELTSAVDASAERAARKKALSALAQKLKVEEEEDLVFAVYALLGDSSAASVLVTIEDLAHEWRPQNVPGTHRERRNFCRRMAKSLGEVATDPKVHQLLGTLRD